MSMIPGHRSTSTILARRSTTKEDEEEEDGPGVPAVDPSSPGGEPAGPFGPGEPVSSCWLGLAVLQFVVAAPGPPGPLG